MAANPNATVSLRILLDEDHKRVVCAETSNDFIDILFSFLTLPMGTIVRLIRKHRSELGCINNLYQSIENLNTSSLWTNACKDMLLYPRTPLEAFFKNLKVNVNDTKTAKCGKLMNREVVSVGNANNAMEEDRDGDGVFVQGSTAYIVSDDLRVMASTPGALVELLGNLGIESVNRLKERVVRVGSVEILNLLEQSLVSKSPLTDLFLPNQRFICKSISLEPRNHQLLSYDIAEKKATNATVKVKILVRKSDGKALCAEAMEDFVDLLFSFLTIPLANVVNCLGGDSSLGCIDNLYDSIHHLEDKWFVTRRVPWSLVRPRLNCLLLNPGLAPKFSCSSQPFELEERSQSYCCYNEETKNGCVCSLTFFPCPSCKPLTLIDPKCPRLETRFGEFVKRPAAFLVSDDLLVIPSSGTTSSISYLKDFDVSIQDVEEQVIKIGKHEALNLLKASLITRTALTRVLNNVVLTKKPKQEH